jgi:hypothetical protein
MKYMANNRFQIYCKKCLEVVPFSKYYPVSWAGVNKKVMDAFLEEHDNKCWANNKDADLDGGTNMYGFRTENDEDIDGFISDYREKPYKLLIPTLKNK